MELTAARLKHFHIAKLFTNNNNIIHVDMAVDGKSVVTCNNEERINVYNCVNGELSPQHFFSRKYGVGLVRFTTNNFQIVHTSTKVDHDIRLLDLQQNSYISYFKGHTDKVSSLATSNTEVFLSGSQDRTVRVWDRRSPSCQGLVNSVGTPIVSFDPTFMIFATITLSSTLHMYDMRSFDKAPFLVVKHNQESKCDWCGIQFSPNERFLLISTNGSTLRLLDAFNGKMIQVFENYENVTFEHLEPSFSPDGKFIFCGSSNGAVHIWDTETGERICNPLKDINQLEVVRFVRFNPKVMMMVAAGTSLAFWIPTLMY